MIYPMPTHKCGRCRRLYISNNGDPKKPVCLACDGPIIRLTPEEAAIVRPGDARLIEMPKP